MNPWHYWVLTSEMDREHSTCLAVFWQQLRFLQHWLEKTLWGWTSEAGCKAWIRSVIRCGTYDGDLHFKVVMKLVSVDDVAFGGTTVSHKFVDGSSQLTRRTFSVYSFFQKTRVFSSAVGGRHDARTSSLYCLPWFYFYLRFAQDAELDACSVNIPNYNLTIATCQAQNNG
jgi:hypothetical protein